MYEDTSVYQSFFKLNYTNSWKLVFYPSTKHLVRLQNHSIRDVVETHRQTTYGLQSLKIQREFGFPKDGFLYSISDAVRMVQ